MSAIVLQFPASSDRAERVMLDGLLERGATPEAAAFVTDAVFAALKKFPATALKFDGTRESAEVIQAAFSEGQSYMTLQLMLAYIELAKHV